MARSKWDVLEERRLEALKEYRKLCDELWGLTQTKFTANGTGRCSACGEVLATEADFAKHFLVPDEQYLNLGYCPKKDNGGSANQSRLPDETREEKVLEDPYV